MQVINNINSRNAKGTCIACNLLTEYLSKKFPVLKDQQELVQALKKVRICCDHPIQDFEFTEAFLEASINRLGHTVSDFKETLFLSPKSQLQSDGSADETKDTTNNDHYTSFHRN